MLLKHFLRSFQEPYEYMNIVFFFFLWQPHHSEHFDEHFLFYFYLQFLNFLNVLVQFVLKGLTAIPFLFTKK